MPSQKKDNLHLEIDAHFASKLPLVLYRRPSDEKVNCVLQTTSELNYLENYTQKGFVFVPFDVNNKNPILIKPDKYLSYVPPNVPDTQTTFYLEVNENKAHHLELVESAIREIKTGSLQKVVVSRKIEITPNFPALDLFHRLVSRYPNAFCYLFFHEQVGIWMGASPELLISVNNLEFKTTSLAGTLPVSHGEAPKWTAKELEEQELVTLFIKEELERLGLQTTVAERKNSKAGKLWHLKSIIRGKLDSFEQLKWAINTLHPTPAVCGLPKSDAKRFILSHENYDREFYTGFLGELNLVEQNTARFFVNLRCMKIEGRNAKIFVGGGITKDSTVQAELQETIRKSRTMLDLF